MLIDPNEHPSSITIECYKNSFLPKLVGGGAESVAGSNRGDDQRRRRRAGRLSLRRRRQGSGEFRLEPVLSSFSSFVHLKISRVDRNPSIDPLQESESIIMQDNL